MEKQSQPLLIVSARTGTRRQPSLQTCSQEAVGVLALQDVGLLSLAPFLVGVAVHLPPGPGATEGGQEALLLEVECWCKFHSVWT